MKPKTVKKQNKAIPLEDLLEADNRRNLRLDCDLPLAIGNDTRGQIVNISKTGFCFTLPDALAKKESAANLFLDQKSMLNTKLNLVWHAKSKKADKYLYGAHIKDLSDEKLSALKGYFSEREDLKQAFIQTVKNFKRELQQFEKFCNIIDTHRFNNRPIKLTSVEYREACRMFDSYYIRLWQIAELFDEERRHEQRLFGVRELSPLIERKIEINRHIFRKPLGYPGDFMMMNYIFDANEGKYFGNTTYERFVNQYTSTIPIAYSTYQRKEYLREKILDVIKKHGDTRIMSVGCGSARELIEIVDAGKVKKPLKVTLIDLDNRALDFVKAELKKIDPYKKEFLEVEFLNLNIIMLLKDDELFKKLKNQHLVYAAGLFDYLSYYIAARLVKILFRLTSDDGSLLLFNASKDRMSHLAYYEMLAHWYLIYRTKDEMYALARHIKNAANIEVGTTEKLSSYYYLDISRK